MDTVHLTALFENATEGIILTRGNGPVVLVNPAAERMFGYQAEELIGRPIEQLIPDRYTEGHKKLRNEFSHHPQNRVMGHGRDLFGKRKDGSEVPLEVSLGFYNKDNEMYVIAFIVDITERKKIELNLLRKQAELEKMAEQMRQLNVQLEVKVEERTRVLRDALNELEHSQKELNEMLEKEKELNEIKGRFISIASHEFRTPLSTVLSSASLLSKYTRTEDQPKRDRHVEKIKNSVRNLNDILEDFLSLGKLDEGKVLAHPSFFRVQNCIREIEEEMSSLLKQGQVIRVEHEGPEDIYLDKRLLKNILINLVTNAIKFSDEGQPIFIKTNTRDGQLGVLIRDEGIGIPAEDRQHLFSSFYRAKNALNIQGTGLGLHIVKRYLDLLGGSITLTSAVDQGTSFYIQIPTTQPAS